MRRAFIQTLTELAATDRRIILLTGDLGYSVLEPFKERFPDRFFNVGVAEQNMIGMATGLAEAGFIPFVYSIATFATLRAYELIRNGPVWHTLQVRIVGVGGGVDYGHDGLSHYGVEDVGILRLLPGMTIMIPADSRQTEQALRSSWNRTGPVYYRLSKTSPALIPGADFERVHLLQEEGNTLLLALGPMVEEVVKAVELLRPKGIRCTVGVVSCISAAIERDLVHCLGRCTRVVTVEGHYITGGLGSWVSEIIATRGLSCRLIRCGISGRLDARAGSQSYLYERYGLSGRAIADVVCREVGLKAS